MGAYLSRKKSSNDIELDAVLLYVFCYNASEIWMMLLKAKIAVHRSKSIKNPKYSSYHNGYHKSHE